MKRRPKILVVEDEAFVAFALEQLLVESGYEVAGPASNVRGAMKLIDTETVDAALLDVNLGKERIDSVAETLAAASIPFIFTTGYTDALALPAEFRDRPTVNKPYQPEQLLEALAQMLGGSMAARAISTGIVRT